MQKAYELDPGLFPQDPFLPQDTPIGPSFLDTGACLCALQDSPAANDGDAKWQCIGNQTQGVYTIKTGKWFNTIHGGSDINLTINDGSNGPSTSKPLVFHPGNRSLRDLKKGDLSVYDQACTGENQTTFSTAFYRATAELEADELPVDGAPCWRPGAVPIQIQNVTSWQSKGCSEGFLCPNNTVNSLPQFCPPITECQMARLSGHVCQFEKKNIGMGPFEPVVCQAGWYCPTSSNGTETLRCPQGSYCQPGASKPTPCNVGSSCPEGSTSQLYLIPLVILVILDILLMGGFFFFSYRKRIRGKAHGGFDSLKKRTDGVKATMTGYKPISDENDHEMAPMDATYVPGRDGWTGFEAALTMANAHDGSENGDESELAPQLRAFVDSMRKATEVTKFGLSFGYSGLNFHPKGSARPVLQNVTGSIERGSLVAVMGGSGAGKSTFVNVLMGKTNHTGGLVSVNNIPGKLKRYKKVTGYVPQDDIVLPELTVYENIVHSARIRLPRTWSNLDIEAHVESVIDCLELSHVRNSLVGSVGKPVISGGQRKRVSIGMELAAAPMAIFLDEPTSGLDATAAVSIMRTLKAIARLGISVIVIIHQPRTEIFDMFDNLILLGNGQTIYEGTQTDVRPYFETVGFSFPEYSNHADVITDIITGNGRDYKRSGDISKEALISHWAQCRSNNATLADDNRNTISSESIQQALKKRGAPRYKQTWLCLRRAMLQQYRTKGAFWSEMGLAALAGFLLGLAENSKKGVLFTGHFREPYSVLSIATDFRSAPELSLLVAIAIGLVSGAPGVKIFSEELLLHRREAEAGHSRLAYFLAKVLSVLPRMTLGCMHFTTLFMLLATPVIPWATGFLANLLYFYCIYGLASCVSMVVRREDAPLFATMLGLIVGILSGAAPPLSKVKKWHMEWLWRASPGVWLAELYFGQLVLPLEYLYDVSLASQATGYHLTWLGRNMLILATIGTIYRFIAFGGLVAGHRLRR